MLGSARCFRGFPDRRSAGNGSTPCDESFAVVNHRGYARGHALVRDARTLARDLPFTGPNRSGSQSASPPFRPLERCAGSGDRFACREECSPCRSTGSSARNSSRDRGGLSRRRASSSGGRNRGGGKSSPSAASVKTGGAGLCRTENPHDRIDGKNHRCLRRARPSVAAGASSFAPRCVTAARLPSA